MVEDGEDHAVAAQHQNDIDDEDWLTDDCSSSTTTAPTVVPYSALDGGQKACEFFGDARFYNSREAATADFNVRARKEAFQDITVSKLMDLWSRSIKDKTEVENMIHVIGACVLRIVDYLDRGETIEMLLHNEIVDLDGTNEMDTVNSCFVNIESTRKKAAVFGEQVVYVMGPSGIGKTYCAVKQVATHGWEEDAHQGTEEPATTPKYTTLYLNLKSLANFNWNDLTVDPRVLEWVKQKLQEHPKAKVKYDKNKQLCMNVAVVLDEAGSTSLHGFFEAQEKVVSICSALGGLVAPGFDFRLVVCGTGLTDPRWATLNDINKIRLDSWSKSDVKKVAKAKFPMLTDESIDAIYRHSMLRSLTTNARTAWFLLEAISSKLFMVEGIQHSRRGSWDRRLEVGATTICDYVLDEYVSKSAIGKLDPRGRRLVASWAFQVAEQSTSHQGKPKPYLPTFDDLGAEYVDAAVSLITLNVDYEDNRTSKLIKKDRPSVFVIPAIALVLYGMLHQPRTDSGDATGKEKTMGFYSLRQAVLDYIDERGVPERHHP
jgi:hypothetical protein